MWKASQEGKACSPGQVPGWADMGWALGASGNRFRTLPGLPSMRSAHRKCSKHVTAPHPELSPLHPDQRGDKASSGFIPGGLPRRACREYGPDALKNRGESCFEGVLTRQLGRAARGM